MEDTKANTGKVALKYGTILGVIGIVLNLMLYFQDLHYQINLKRLLFMGIFSLVIIVIGAVLSIKEFKKLNGGYVSFMQGIKIGVATALITSIIGILFGIVMSEVIDPELNDKAANYMESWMSETPMTRDQIVEEVSKVRNPNYFRNVGQGLVFSIIFGFLGSAIPALILKKSEETFQ